MTLVNPQEPLKAARAEGWAVGGFNIYNLESARAVVDAAAGLDSPVIVQCSPGAIAHAGLDNLVGIVRRLAEGVGVPVALHLDHGKDPNLARAAIFAGFTSVMIDTSGLPIDENITETRKIVEIAHARGVYVEAELGNISGIEDVGDTDIAETLTVPEEAVRFIDETNADALAVAIGTAHGAVKFAGEPRLDFDRLKEIAGLIDRPLVLHGASAILEKDVALAERFGAELPDARGVPGDLIQRAIKLGIAKINTDSDLRLAALGRMRQVLAETPGLFNMYQLMGEIQGAVKNSTSDRIRLLGSAGKAAL